MILPDEYKEEILRAAEITLRDPAELWAYGSRVTGAAKNGSDLDLVIRRDGLQKVEWRQLMDFHYALEVSRLPIAVQAFDWARLPDAFRQNILRRYEVLAKITPWQRRVD